MALTLISTITSAALSWKEFFRGKTRLKVPCNKFKWFFKFLEFDPKQFFILMNHGIKFCIKPEIKANLDKSIWPCLKSHFSALYIEKNPNPDGFECSCWHLN